MLLLFLATAEHQEATSATAVADSGPTGAPLPTSARSPPLCAVGADEEAEAQTEDAGDVGAALSGAGQRGWHSRPCRVGRGAGSRRSGAPPGCVSSPQPSRPTAKLHAAFRRFGQQRLSQVGLTQAALQPFDCLHGQCAGLMHSQVQFATGVAQREQDPLGPGQLGRFSVVDGGSGSAGGSASEDGWGVVFALPGSVSRVPGQHPPPTPRT